LLYGPELSFRDIGQRVLDAHKNITDKASNDILKLARPGFDAPNESFLYIQPYIQGYQGHLLNNNGDLQSYPSYLLNSEQLAELFGQNKLITKDQNSLHAAGKEIFLKHPKLSTLEFVVPSIGDDEFPNLAAPPVLVQASKPYLANKLSGKTFDFNNVQNHNTLFLNKVRINGRSPADILASLGGSVEYTLPTLVIDYKASSAEFKKQIADFITPNKPFILQLPGSKTGKLLDDHHDDLIMLIRLASVVLFDVNQKLDLDMHLLAEQERKNINQLYIRYSSTFADLPKIKNDDYLTLSISDKGLGVKVIDPN
jgi:hypothetical protein